MEKDNIEQLNRKFCKRCHRELKNEKYKELGYGPICYSKIIKQQSLNLFEMEELN